MPSYGACWGRGRHKRRCPELHLFLGHDRRMTWHDVADGGVRVAAQEKTGATVDAPMHPDLAATVAERERRGVVIVLSQYNRPFSTGSFCSWMALAIARAGLPERCVTHGLRKAAARRLADAGYTTHRIAAITGHKTLKEIARYTEAADRKGLADDAMAKVMRARTGLKFAQFARKPKNDGDSNT